MPFDLAPSPWLFFTRLGEAQILLPLALAAVAWTAWHAPRSRACVGRWMVCIGLAALLTTLTKVAFIGWGWGIARLDFTGLSGHAMFAAAVLPVVLRLMAADAAPARARAAVALGLALAAAVAVSRVAVQAHSWSEVVGGFTCGALASGCALALWRHLPALRVPAALWVVVPVAVLTSMQAAPPSRTHDWMTALSLQLSGRTQPCTRQRFHADGCLAAADWLGQAGLPPRLR